MKKIRWTDPDSGEVFEFPARWEICSECHGDGKHVHRAIDAGDRSDWDGDDWEDYFSGRYDVFCETCEGSGKVQELCLGFFNDWPYRLRRAYARMGKWQLAEFDSRQEQRAEWRALGVE